MDNLPTTLVAFCTYFPPIHSRSLLLLPGRSSENRFCLP